MAKQNSGPVSTAKQLVSKTARIVEEVTLVGTDQTEVERGPETVLQVKMDVWCLDRPGTAHAITTPFIEEGININFCGVYSTYAPNLGGEWFEFEATFAQLAKVRDEVLRIVGVQKVVTGINEIDERPAPKLPPRRVPLPPGFRESAAELMAMSVGCDDKPGALNTILKQIFEHGGDVKGMGKSEDRNAWPRSEAVVYFLLIISPARCGDLRRALEDETEQVDWAFPPKLVLPKLPADMERRALETAYLVQQYLYDIDDNNKPLHSLGDRDYNSPDAPEEPNAAAEGHSVEGEGFMLPPLPPPARPGPPGIEEEKKKTILEAVKRDPDHNFSRVAREYGVSKMTVARIVKKKFRAGGKPGFPISDEKREAVVALLPDARSMTAIAAAVGVDGKTVAKIKRQQEEKSQRPSRQTSPSRHVTLG